MQTKFAAAHDADQTDDAFALALVASFENASPFAELAFGLGCAIRWLVVG